MAKLGRMIVALQSQAAKVGTAPQLPNSAIVDGTLDLVDDRPEEVGGPVLDDRLHQIIEQLRAV